MTSFYSTADFWFTVSFIIMMLIAFKPLKNFIIVTLDNRANSIRTEIEEMTKPVNEADLVLSEFKNKYDGIDKELAEIALNTEKELRLLRENSDREILQYIKQKSHQLLEKIASEEKRVLERLRSESISLATMVSADIIKEQIDTKLTEEQIEKSFAIAKEKLKL